MVKSLQKFIVGPLLQSFSPYQRNAQGRGLSQLSFISQCKLGRILLLNYNNFKMKKQKAEKQQKNQYIEIKQQETNLQKFLSTLFRLFVRQEKVSSEISQAVVAGTYFQIFGTINIIVIFTVFNNTNSFIYALVISSQYLILILIDIFPKVSKKHYVFNFVSIAEGLILISIFFCHKLLLDNYLVFYEHCQEFIQYHSSRTYVIGPKQAILDMCNSISFKFLTEIIAQIVLIVIKIVHIGLYIRAYRQAKEKFDEDERKKRRKDRYNEMMRKRYVYNQKRKV